MRRWGWNRISREIQVEL